MNASATRARSKRPRIRQLVFHAHGGARRGAGRKPKGARPLVSHATRPALAARHPVLVTCKRASKVPSLRSSAAKDVLHAACRAVQRDHALRLVHFSIQVDHLHLIVEARDAPSLSRAMQRLCIRIAQGLNRLWKRAGRIFADRFHARALRTPREVRHALAYVLLNARKHGLVVPGLDPCSSAAAFDGWSTQRAPFVDRRIVGLPIAQPRTWLLSVGWRRHGLIRPDEVPGLQLGGRRARSKRPTGERAP